MNFADIERTIGDFGEMGGREIHQQRLAVALVQVANLLRIELQLAAPDLEVLALDVELSRTVEAVLDSGLADGIQVPDIAIEDRLHRCLERGVRELEKRSCGVERSLGAVIQGVIIDPDLGLVVGWQRWNRHGMSPSSTKISR